jgi:hypothetical protein
MKPLSTHIVLIAGALALFAMGGAQAAAVTLPVDAPLACAAGSGEYCDAIQYAQSGCAAAAAAVAREMGGEVIGAPQTVQQGGQTMCVVTILIRDPTGQRPPTRQQVTVPAR